MGNSGIPDLRSETEQYRKKIRIVHNTIPVHIRPLTFGLGKNRSGQDAQHRASTTSGSRASAQGALYCQCKALSESHRGSICLFLHE